MEIFDEDDDAKKVFIDDVIEKQTVVRSSKKQVLKKKPLLPNQEELAKLNGEVKVLDNVYKKIPDYSEFKLLGMKDKHTTLKGLITNGHTPKEIAEKWGIQPQAIYDWQYRLKKRMENELKSIKDDEEELEVEDQPQQEPVPEVENKALKAFIKESNLQPFYISIIRNAKGKDIYPLLLNIFKLADKEKMYNFIFAIQRILNKNDTGKFTFNIELSDNMCFDTFMEEIQSLTYMLDSSEYFQFKLKVEELNII